MILGEYRAPWQEREIKPEMSDVHVARADVFEVGSWVSEVDLAAFDHEGQPHLPWKDMQKGPPHMSQQPFAEYPTYKQSLDSKQSRAWELVKHIEQISERMKVIPMALID